MKNGFLLKGLSLLALTGGYQSMHAKKDSRPNIIVILADDLGYSDMGCYGGEIETPNLDKLAQDGLRFTNFYNTSRSCPTRASLLTGLYQHQAGIGRMTFDEGQPGYKGQLTDNSVTVAEVLKESGYNTGMVGKWHVAETPLREDQREWLAHHVQYDEFADKKYYPVNKGFDDYYGIIYGVANYFDPFSLVSGEEPVKSVPKDYYITQAFSDSAVSYVNKYADMDDPFFLYLSYTAPHWPLHALPEDIAKYEDTYKDGWEAIRNKRYQKMLDMNLFGKNEGYLSARQSHDDWKTNPDKEWDARAMAVHAAMVDRMDRGIGELLEALEKNGQLDNTLILFMSDNGCSSEDAQNYSPGENDRPDMTRSGETIHYPKLKKWLPGPEETFASIGSKWANVTNTPFRFWKARQNEGGICTPMIAHWPKGLKHNKGGVTQEMGHVMDIMATCIDLAKVDYPETYNGNNIIPLEGKSLIPIFKKGKRARHEFLAFEHFNEKALISEDGWKIVQGGNDQPWELYNLKDDRTEMKNLADSYPNRVEKMVKQYDEWAIRALVFPQP